MSMVLEKNRTSPNTTDEIKTLIGNIFWWDLEVLWIGLSAPKQLSM